MKKHSGIALLGVLITLAIIAALVALYYGNSERGRQSSAQTGKKAIEETKQNNTTQIEQHIEIQNELNSIQ